MSKKSQFVSNFKPILSPAVYVTRGDVRVEPEYNVFQWPTLTERVWITVPTAHILLLYVVQHKSN